MAEDQMVTSENPSSQGCAWKEFYLAALMEADRDKTTTRMAQAECAIVNRARELFRTSGDNIQEEEALDDALYALAALKSCLKIHGGFAVAA